MSTHSVQISGWKIVALWAVLLFVLPYSSADTITMKNGVQIEGVVLRDVGGVLQVRIGDRQVRVYKEEVLTVEKNEKDGSIDMKTAQEAAAEEDRKLTAELGLNQKQREEVMKHIRIMAEDDPAKRNASRQALSAMAKEMDIFPFLLFILPSYLPHTVSYILDLLADLDQARAIPVLREYTGYPDENVRAKALELLGKLKDGASLEFILRGMVDHSYIVKSSACKALASLGAKEATPLLLQHYNHGDLYVQNSAREALSVIWSTDANKIAFATLEEWQSFWEANKAGVATQVNIEALEPLVPPGTHFPGC